MKKFEILLALLLGCFLSPLAVLAQVTPDSTAGRLSLEQCVAFALENQAQVQLAQLDEEIGERQIRGQLAGWLPQLAANYAFTHNLKLPQSVFGDQVITIGQRYTSNINFQATQTLYSNDLLLASRAARFTRLSLDLNTRATKINTVVQVSKAFYNILLSQEQLRILDENITRQEKQYRDAFAQYEQGLVDKTDYQRATITLNSIRADRKRTQESIKAQTAYLQELMGLPVNASLSLAYDYEQMQQDIFVDTTQTITYASRVEYQQLQNQRQVQDLNTRYFRWGFLPTASAFINYNPTFFSNNFSDVYRQSYPTSATGVQVGFPIFQGGRRLQNVRISLLQEQSLELELENVERSINTEYQSALAGYKSDYNDWLTLQTNVQLAQEVYNIIKLQYDEGIKAYLDLIVAETDLRTAQLNYYNALYDVLSSKLDVQRALGTIAVN